MLERQHQGLKNSLKAALIDMGQTHQDRWYDFLPFVLLGRRVAFQPDMQASASELTFRKNVTIPGQLLINQETLTEEVPSVELLKLVRSKTDTETHQPSRHCPPEKVMPQIPENITQVYTKQHQTTGLQPSFEGPFRVEERTSRSVWKIEVGSYKDGRKRYEYRHVNDLKFAHPKSLAAPIERPKLGRPAAVPSDVQGQTEAKNSVTAEETPSNRFSRQQLQLPEPPHPPRQLDSKQNGIGDSINHATSTPECQQPALPAGGGNFQTTDRPKRSTRNPNPLYVDSLRLQAPPRAWSATESEIQWLNASIMSPPVVTAG